MGVTADGFPSVVPYLYYEDATTALEFPCRAFGFVEHKAVRDPEGVVWTAQLRVGDGLVMVGPGVSEFGTRAVTDGDRATSRVHVLVDDLDAHYERAVAAGARIIAERNDHGDVRIYLATDCGGHEWIFAEPLTA
jgi:uncharacterized glyoxalase superfamily protein PhnB